MWWNSVVSYEWLTSCIKLPGSNHSTNCLEEILGARAARFSETLRHLSDAGRDRRWRRTGARGHAGQMVEGLIVVKSSWTHWLFLVAGLVNKWWVVIFVIKNEVGRHVKGVRQATWGSSLGSMLVLVIILHHFPLPTRCPCNCSPPVSNFTTHCWIGPGRAIPQWNHRLKLEQFTGLHTNLYTLPNWFGLKEAVSGHRVEEVQKSLSRLQQTDNMLTTFSSGPYFL